MQIKIQGLGMRYRQEWIFRQLDAQLEVGSFWGVTGHNGSGKSTLLKVLSGFVSPTVGNVEVLKDGKLIAPEYMYQQVSMAAPYIDLIEEFTLTETLRFHNKFVQWRNGMQNKDVIATLGLPKGAANKELRWFSSGMKQRVRLATAILSNTSLLLLDEPGSNLDKQGDAWWQQLVLQHANNRIVIIGGNADQDLALCQSFIHLPDYKKR
jgi:ABC-type multidrug transport system ATPase subunit